MMRGLIILAAWLGFPFLAGAQIQNIELRAPRSFGYVTGDIIRLDAVIAVSADHRLNASSLPGPRPIRHWLDLRRLEIMEATDTDDQRRYTLHFEYQTLDAPLDPAKRTVPPMPIQFDSADGPLTAEIPAWSFLMTPLRGRASHQEIASELMPDFEPRLLETASHLRAAIACAIGAALCLVLLAWQHAWWPFYRRSARPFTLAWRAMNARTKTECGGRQSYHDCLRILHRAFDAVSGRRLFASQLDMFFRENPSFLPVQSDISAFFAASRRAFFGGDPEGAACELPLSKVQALGRRLSQIERAQA